jgi:hypothetical protein
MVFWLAILVGGLFAWLAVKAGFYDTWTILFNIVVAIYMAVFLTPVVAEFVPAVGGTSCCNALTLIAIAIGTFFILYGISYTFITGQFNVSFPRVFDILFAGLMGFLAGFLVSSFVAFVFCVTPISQNKIANEIGLNRQSQQANISYICWWCDLVNGVVASKDSDYTSEKAIDWLFQSTEEKKPGDSSIKQADTNKPPDANDTIADISEKIPPKSPPQNHPEYSP